MKIEKLNIKKIVFHRNELPPFVIDESNKTLFLSIIIIVTGLFLSIKSSTFAYISTALILCVMYAASFFFFYYRHFIYDNLLIYDGTVISSEESSSAKGVAKKISNHYVRKLFTIETDVVSETDGTPFTICTHVKGTKISDDYHVRLYLLPDSFIKNNDGSYNAVTIHAEILSVPRSKRGRK